MFDLKGKTALVTGASSGLGAHFAQVLATAGAKVIVTARREHALMQAGNVLPYAVAKAGVVQMTKTLALELARFDIRVNALAPGYLDTDLNREFLQTDAGKALVKRIPQRRLGKLAELSAPLLLLASDAASYMTGTVLAVDGGHLVSSL